MTKEDIYKCLLNYASTLSYADKKIVRFNFVSEMKPAHYFLPSIKFSTKHALEIDGDPMMAWFCEIWADGICIYRTSKIPTNESKEEIEQIVLKEFVEHLFEHGINACYNAETERKKRERENT